MKCPECGTSWVDPLFSMNKLFCYQCNVFRPFELKPKKKSILNDGYVGDRDKYYVNKPTKKT